MKLLKDHYFFDARWTAVMMQDFLHAIGFKEVEIHFGQNFHGEQGWFCDSVSQTEFDSEISWYESAVIHTAGSKPSIDSTKIFREALEKSSLLHGNDIESWKASDRPIFYIDHTGECYCSPVLDTVLLKAETGLEIDEHCYVGVIDFRKEVKENFNCYEDVADLIADQLGECTEDKTMDVCLYNSTWCSSDKDKQSALKQVKSDEPCDIDFERYRNFYAWKKSDRPIYYADNAGCCWASDDLDWMKDTCIHDIKHGGVDFVEIHIQNYDKETRLKLNDYEDICDMEIDATPVVDEIIFAAKFYEDCTEDMPLMTRKKGILAIKNLSFES